MLQQCCWYLSSISCMLSFCPVLPTALVLQPTALVWPCWQPANQLDFLIQCCSLALLPLKALGLQKGLQQKILVQVTLSDNTSEKRALSSSVLP